MPMALKIRLQSRNQLILIVIFVGVVALTLRLMFVSEVIMQNDPGEIVSITPDSKGYLHLARNLADDGTYALSDIQSRSTALIRTPGYPMFLAALDLIGFSLGDVLLIQAFIGALIPVGTVLIVNAILQSRLTGFFAGLVSAISPSGVGITGVLLSDLLFAAVFMGGILMLYYGVAIQRPYLSLSAGVIFGIAALIKPILLFWPVASSLLCLLFARAESAPVKWKHIVIFCLFQVVLLLAWSTRNYVVEHIFMPSSIGSKNLRHYVAPRVEEWARAGHDPSGDAIKHNRKTVFVRERYAMAAKKATPADIASQQMSESLAIFRKYPFITFQVYLANVRGHLISRWSHLRSQLPGNSFLEDQLARLAEFSRQFRKLWLTLIAFAMLDLVLFRCQPPGDKQRRHFGILSLILVIGYFVAFAGTTFWTGSRILYPVEFAFISLSLAGAVAMANVIRTSLLFFRNRGNSAVKMGRDRPPRNRI